MQAAVIGVSTSEAMANFWPTKTHSNEMVETTMDYWEAFSRADYEGITTVLLCERMKGRALFDGLLDIVRSSDQQLLRFFANVVVTTQLVTKDLYMSDLHSANIFIMHDGTLGFCDIDLAILPKIMRGLHERYLAAKIRFQDQEVLAPGVVAFSGMGYVHNNCSYGSLHDFMQIFSSFCECLTANQEIQSFSCALHGMFTTFMDYFANILFTDPQSGMAIGTITDGLLESLFAIALDRETTLGAMEPFDNLSMQNGISL